MSLIFPSLHFLSAAGSCAPGEAFRSAPVWDKRACPSRRRHRATIRASHRAREISSPMLRLSIPLKTSVTSLASPCSPGKYKFHTAITSVPSVRRVTSAEFGIRGDSPISQPVQQLESVERRLRQSVFGDQAKAAVERLLHHSLLFKHVGKCSNRPAYPPSHRIAGWYRPATAP